MACLCVEVRERLPCDDLCLREAELRRGFGGATMFSSMAGEIWLHDVHERHTRRPRGFEIGTRRVAQPTNDAMADD